MKNNKLFKELDKFNRKRALDLNKAIRSELKSIPKKQADRDEIIAFNLSMLFAWGYIKF